MTAFKCFNTRFLAAVLLATAAGLCSSAAQAKAEALFLTRSSELIDLHIAYTAHRWPVYRDVHQKKKYSKADFASFEDRSDPLKAGQAETRPTRGYHRHPPYSGQRR